MLLPPSNQLLTSSERRQSRQMRHQLFLLLNLILIAFLNACSTISTPTPWGFLRTEDFHHLTSNDTNIHLNTTASQQTTWPVHLPFRYPIPYYDSGYLIIPSYTTPQRPPKTDDVLAALIAMIQKLSRDGQPGDTFTSIRLRDPLATWEFSRERPFVIERQTAVVVLNAAKNLEIEFGLASLKNVLFQHKGIVIGSFDLNISTSSLSALRQSQGSQPVSLETS